MQFFLETAADGGNGGTGWMSIIMLVAVVVIFYFLLIRPQKKQEKEAANMRNSLEIGDEVVTIGGIIGQIVSIKGETVTIATGKDRNKIRFLRSAIREVTVKINAPHEEEVKTKDEGAIAEAPIKDESDKPVAEATIEAQDTSEEKKD